MTVRHRLLRTALGRRGGFSPELETWISGLAADERARSRDSASAGAVIAELEAILALEQTTTADAEARPSSALDLSPDEYVRTPRSTLMRARDLLERLRLCELNDVLRAVAGTHDVEVADTHQRFPGRGPVPKWLKCCWRSDH